MLLKFIPITGAE